MASITATFQRQLGPLGDGHSMSCKMRCLGFHDAEYLRKIGETMNIKLQRGYLEILS